MKKILYYVTDHGLGHATRTVAIIRELEKLGIKIIIRNSTSKSFLEQSLPSIQVIEGKTDMGPNIQENGISIDIENSVHPLNNWISSIESVAEKEINVVEHFEPNLIISDISPMPFPLAKRFNIPSIAISNFSWFDVLSFLPRSNLDKLKNFYDDATTLIQLPLGTRMDHFDQKFKAGVVSRSHTKTKNEIRKEIGVENSEKMILIILGNSKNQLNITSEKNVKIVSTSNKIHNSINLSNWVEGQDLISASDLVICKCGYGVISECLTTSTPFLYVYDQKHLEQLAISEEISTLKLNNQITINEINKLHLDENLIDSIMPPKKMQNDTKNVAHYISEYI